MAVVEVRRWEGNLVLFELDIFEIGTASLVDDGFGFVAQHVVSEAATQGLAQVVYERVHSM